MSWKRGQGRGKKATVKINTAKGVCLHIKDFGSAWSKQTTHMTQHGRFQHNKQPANRKPGALLHGSLSSLLIQGGNKHRKSFRRVVTCLLFLLIARVLMLDTDVTSYWWLSARSKLQSHKKNKNKKPTPPGRTSTSVCGPERPGHSSSPRG